jgi:hypothetical protein
VRIAHRVGKEVPGGIWRNAVIRACGATTRFYGKWWDSELRRGKGYIFEVFGIDRWKRLIL